MANEILRFSEHVPERQTCQFTEDGPIYTLKARGDLTPRESIRVSELFTAQMSQLIKAEDIDKSLRASDFSRVQDSAKAMLDMRIELARIAIYSPEPPSAEEFLDMPQAVLEGLENFLLRDWGLSQMTLGPTQKPSDGSETPQTQEEAET